MPPCMWLSLMKTTGRATVRDGYSHGLKMESRAPQTGAQCASADAPISHGMSFVMKALTRSTVLPGNTTVCGSSIDKNPHADLRHRDGCPWFKTCQRRSTSVSPGCLDVPWSVSSRHGACLCVLLIEADWDLDYLDHALMSLGSVSCSCRCQLTTTLFNQLNVLSRTVRP